jgi:hypothetical protein
MLRRLNMTAKGIFLRSIVQFGPLYIGRAHEAFLLQNVINEHEPRAHLRRTMRISRLFSLSVLTYPVKRFGGMPRRWPQTRRFSHSLTHFCTSTENRALYATQNKREVAQENVKEYGRCTSDLEVQPCEPRRFHTPHTYDDRYIR